MSAASNTPKSATTSATTALLQIGRPKSGWVNMPVTRGSTYLFETVSDWQVIRRRRADERVLSYGAHGTDSTHALEDAVVALEGGYRGRLFPTGLAAIAITFLAYLKSGDHVLVADSVYEPARRFCADSLARLGISYTYYKPDGSDLATKIQPNTTMVYAENPGSLAYEMMDIRAVAAFAKQHGCILAVDNTWGSGILHKPLELGADVSIIAATKYLCGHSDVMMGTVVTNQDAWPALEAAALNYGQTVGADDAYLVLRGMRTLAVRMKVHEQHLKIVADWLQQHPRVAKVLHPAYMDGKDREIYERDFSGSNGLLSVEFVPSVTQTQMEAMIDGLQNFGLGASWGGFESLCIPTNLPSVRTLSSWDARGPICRIHVGLEEPADLIADLQQAFAAHLG